MFELDIVYAKKLVDEYFRINDKWKFNLYYKFITEKTGVGDNLIKTLLLIPIINITTANIGFSYKMPGYYDDSYSFFGGNFLEYYNDPDHNYYFFMYNLTDDPNELTNLLDKGYPDRKLIPNVLATAESLNDKLNLVIDKYKIVYFDFIVPESLFVSFALNLKIQGVLTPLNAYIYNNCFRLNKTDGEYKTPYYYDVLNILKQIKAFDV